jgi:acyl-CoA synthetase (AMP-forming)/AMP-acid ligase II
MDIAKRFRSPRSEKRREQLNSTSLQHAVHVGTNGLPKGVMLTHYNVVNNGKAIGDCMDLSTEDKLLIHVRCSTAFGMVLAMTRA